MRWFGAGQNGVRDQIGLGLVGRAGTEDTGIGPGVGRKFRPAGQRQVVLCCFCQFNGRI